MKKTDQNKTTNTNTNELTLTLDYNFILELRIADRDDERSARFAGRKLTK